MAYKPDGYTSAAPYLMVDGAQATIDFLVAVFAAEPLRIIPNDRGGLLHGEVKIDDTVLMLTDGAPGWPPVPAHVHIYVANVDEVFERALAHGATAVQAPVQKPGDLDKRGGFRDAGGTTWWVAQQMPTNA